MTTSYQLIDSLSDVSRCCTKIQDYSEYGLDTETTGLDPHTDRIRLIQIAIPNRRVLVFDLFKLGEEAKPYLSEVLSDTASTKILQNAKFDIKMFWGNGIDIAGNIFDTEIAARLIDAGLHSGGEYPGYFKLDAICKRFLGEYFLSKEFQTSNWSQEHLDLEQVLYAAKDAYCLNPLKEELSRQLKTEKLEEVAQIEFDCVWGVAEMEFVGIRLNKEEWMALHPIYEKMRDTALVEIMEYFPEVSMQMSLFGAPDFLMNLGSSKQLLEKLRNLGIPDPDPAEGNVDPLIKSTSQQILKLLDEQQYPIIDPLVRWKKANKRLTSFLNTFLSYINPATGRIHASFWQMGTDTGRFSSSNPNLQQIPREKEIRRCFIPRDGYKLIVADYSQIELRAGAEIANEKVMMGAYNKGQDLHALTASLVSGVPLDKIAKSDRQKAKAVNFGYIYGMGAKKFRKYAKVSYGVALTDNEALEFRNRYFKGYPGLSVWHKSLGQSKASKIRTLSGRLRKWHGEAPFSALANTPVQGTAGDMTKVAIGEVVKKLGPLSTRLKQEDSIFIVATVHDEILLESPESKAEFSMNLLKETMEKAGIRFLKKVPVVADAGIADSWADK